MWTAESDHPFAGIATKLARADQNIIYLAAEIYGFFEKSKYPVFPNPNDQCWQEAVDYHHNLPIPRRFSVLAGEIVHHLRSSLDHIVWIFSNESARRLHENALGFPILCEFPDKNKLSGFKRQIQGVDKPSVRKLITDLQPYQSGADVANDPLCIIHDMDRFDKHRELVIVTACVNFAFPRIPSADIVARLMACQQGEVLSTADIAALMRAVKQDGKIFPQVAFPKFGKRETQFVVPSLTKLLHAVNDVTELFAREL
jgi:hypothetical protein